MHRDDLVLETSPGRVIGRAKVERQELDLFHLEEHLAVAAATAALALARVATATAACAAATTRTRTRTRTRCAAALLVKLHCDFPELVRNVVERLLGKVRVQVRVPIVDLLREERVDLGLLGLEVARKLGLLVHETVPDLV